MRSLMLGVTAIPYAVLMTAFGVGVWKSAGPKRAGRIAGALLVGYAAVGLVMGVLFRMNTRKALAAGQAGWRNNLHLPGTLVRSLLALGGGAGRVQLAHPCCQRTTATEQAYGDPAAGTALEEKHGRQA